MPSLSANRLKESATKFMLRIKGLRMQGCKESKSPCVVQPESSLENPADEPVSRQEEAQHAAPGRNLLDLPLEIRLLIYDHFHYLKENTTINLPFPNMPLLNICHQIRSELIQHLPPRHLFVIDLAETVSFTGANTGSIDDPQDPMYARIHDTTSWLRTLSPIKPSPVQYLTLRMSLWVFLNLVLAETPSSASQPTTSPAPWRRQFWADFCALLPAETRIVHISINSKHTRQELQRGEGRFNISQIPLKSYRTWFQATVLESAAWMEVLLAALKEARSMRVEYLYDSRDRKAKDHFLLQDQMATFTVSLMRRLEAERVKDGDADVVREEVRRRLDEAVAERYDMDWILGWS